MPPGWLGQDLVQERAKGRLLPGHKDRGCFAKSGWTCLCWTLHGGYSPGISQVCTQLTLLYPIALSMCKKDHMMNSKVKWKLEEPALISIILSLGHLGGWVPNNDVLCALANAIINQPTSIPNHWIMKEIFCKKGRG